MVCYRSARSSSADEGNVVADVAWPAGVQRYGENAVKPTKRTTLFHQQIVPENAIIILAAGVPAKS